MNLSSPMPKNPEAFPVMLYVPGGFRCRIPSSGEIRKGQNARFSRIRFDCFYPSREKLFLFIRPPSGKILFLRVRILCFLKEYSENTGERKKLQKNLILVFHFASKRGILFSGGNAGQNEWKIG